MPIDADLVTRIPSGHICIETTAMEFGLLRTIESVRRGMASAARRRPRLSGYRSRDFAVARRVHNETTRHPTSTLGRRKRYTGVCFSLNCR
jgi:hypothetical protein